MMKLRRPTPFRSTSWARTSLKPRRWKKAIGGEAGLGREPLGAERAGARLHLAQQRVKRMPWA
jgi:hypothetical protein